MINAITQSVDTLYTDGLLVLQYSKRISTYDTAAGKHDYFNKGLTFPWLDEQKKQLLSDWQFFAPRLREAAPTRLVISHKISGACERRAIVLEYRARRRMV